MKKILAILMFITFTSAFAQEQKELKKDNTIIYINFDGLVGSGFFGGFGLNYQKDKHLFTFRVMYYEQLKLKSSFIFPTYEKVNSTLEFGFLYGKRWVQDNHAFNISGGISFNQFTKYDNESSFLIFPVYSSGSRNTVPSIGFPFELTVHWFKRKKEPFRVLYGLLPVGPPTAIGRNFGFKISGNISNQSYVGIGMTVGLGMHKLY